MATTLLDRIPSLLSKRKGFGGKKIPFEQFVEKKLARFKVLARTSPIVKGVSGPVTEEMIYLLCNGQKRMNDHELQNSTASLELWKDPAGDEEVLALELMKSIVDRNAGRLDAAKERIEKTIIPDVVAKRLGLGCNDWVSGFSYYELAVISWKQKQPADEVRGWLKKASDVGDFPLSSRLSIRLVLYY